MITTHKDPEGRTTIFDKIPRKYGRLISVGRLDYNTEGLIILTNNGDIKRFLELPSNVITGQFEVKILHYRNSKLVSQQINSINVSKSGISAEIYNIAQNYSTLYGIFAVFLAVLVGWGSNLIFRKV